jgi:hypothetical protein
MSDGNNSVSERRFLERFLVYYFCDLPRFEGLTKNDEEQIDTFLEQHHQMYYEVEFIKKQLESDDEYEIRNTS